MAKRMVKCYYCGKTFDANSEPFTKPTDRRYAHLACAEAANKGQIELETYLKQIYQINEIPSKIQKQITSYISRYGYSYEGIYKSLYYFYEIKKNHFDPTNYTIGIVPYIYDEAKVYYYNLWMAQQQNKEKDFSQYVPQVQEIVIQNPERPVRKHRFFSFLDRDEVEGD